MDNLSPAKSMLELSGESFLTDLSDSQNSLNKKLR
jgi:hypothetical protein